MKVYVASPLFTEDEKNMIRQVAHALTAAGHEVYLPMEHGVPDAWTYSNPDWGKNMFDIDVAAIDSSDAVLVIYNGMNSDTGTAWEAGYGYAKGKTIVIYHNYDVHHFIGSLMVCNGARSNIEYVSDIAIALKLPCTMALPYQS